MSDQSNNTSDVKEENNVIVQEDDASEITDSLKTLVSSPYRRTSIQIDADDRPRKKQKFNVLRQLWPDMSESEESTLGMAVDGIPGDSDVVHPQTVKVMKADEMDGAPWRSSTAQKYCPQPTTSHSAEAACSSEVSSRDSDDQPSKVLPHCNPQILVGSKIQLHEVEHEMSNESVPEHKIHGRSCPTPGKAKASLIKELNEDPTSSSSNDVISRADDGQPKKAVQQGKTKETGGDTSDSSSKQSGDLEGRQDPPKKVKINPFDLRRAMFNFSNTAEMEDSPSSNQEDSSSKSDLLCSKENSSDIDETSNSSTTSNHLQQELIDIADFCSNSLRSTLRVLQECDVEMLSVLEKLEFIIRTHDETVTRESITDFLLDDVRGDIKKFLINLNKRIEEVDGDNCTLNNWLTVSTLA